MRIRFVKLCDCHFCHLTVFDDKNAYHDDKYGYIHKSCAIKNNRVAKAVKESEAKK